jgi:hypothetical protein
MMSAAGAGRWLLVLAVAGSALAIGAVHTQTLCVVAVALVGALLALSWRAEPSGARASATLLFWTGVALTAWTALQCVPLPIGWLAAIAPHNADVWARSLAPLHEQGPAWAPLSLDPGATRVAVLKGLVILCAFLAALRVTRRRDGVTFLAVAVVITGLVLVTAAVLHPAFGAKKVFGWYEPGPGIDGRHVAPLLNANHLAAYVDVAFCLALGMLVTRTPRVPRSLSAAAVVILAAGQVWVASRSGVVAMVLGAVVTVAMARAERADAQRSPTWVSGVSLAAVLGGAVVIALLSNQDVSTELLDANASKLAGFVKMLRMVPAHPVFGVGRGAFESTYPAFRSDVGHVTYSNPENLILQWTTEWGVPVGLAGLAAIAFALRPTTALPRSRTAGGAWAALLAVGAHDIADFATEVPAVAVACAVCAAIVAGGEPGRQPSTLLERWSVRPRAVAAIGALAVVAAGIVALAGLHEELDADRAVLQACISGGDPVSVVHERARAAMLRHPGEPYLPFAVGLRAAHARDENPLPWLGATLERAAVYGPAHLVLARLVSRASPSQARMEYRLALAQAPTLLPVVEGEAARVVGGYDDARELAPEGLYGIELLQAVADAVAARLPATHARLELDLARLAPKARAPTKSMADDAVGDLEAGEAAPWCVGGRRATCAQLALERARELANVDADSCDGPALEARVFSATGDAGEGLRRLHVAASTRADREGCLRALVQQAIAAGKPEEAESALEQLARPPCDAQPDCLARLQWVAKEQEQLGHVGHAAMTMRRAHQAAPWDDALLLEAARLASAAGLHAEALADYELLVKREPGHPTWPKKAAAEAAAVAKAAASF